MILSTGMSTIDQIDHAVGLIGTDALVVAISERRDVVSLYLGGMKYILQDLPAVLAKPDQGLATPDK